MKLLYVGVLVGVVVGAMLMGLWAERKPKKPDWLDRFERDCALLRKQAG